MAKEKSRTTHEILAALKDLLKERGYTYARLAKTLKLSEPTLKRFFSGQTPVPLERLEDICRELGVEVSDLFLRARQTRDQNYFFSADQEAYFARHPGLLGVFRALHAGTSPEQVRKSWRLSAAEYFKALRQLERLRLIDLNPDERIVFRTRGVLRWSHTGPLTERLVPEQNGVFFAHLYENLGRATTSFLTSEAELSRESFEELCAEVQELGRKYRGIALRESLSLPKSALLSVRWVAGVAPFRTDWTKYEL